MDTTTLVLFLAGIGLLVAGAEALVRGASRLAAAVGISPLVIGLTVVAFGTGSPELAVTLQASLAGQGDLGVGNIVGSNILNVLLILGLSAVIAPLVVAQRLVRWDVPLMIAASGLLWWLGADGVLDRLDGAILFGGIVAYIVLAVVQGPREGAGVKAEYRQEYADRPGRPPRVVLQLVLIVVGLGMLLLGSHWLVEGAVELARHFGLSELVIGLTVLAVGTSLPEAATSVIATFRGERDIAVGNVIGSNLFNILAVLGVAGLAAPGGLPVPQAARSFDLPVMTAVAVACLPIFFINYRISRWEGLLFLGYYGAYTAYLVLEAGHHDSLQLFEDVMLYFVIPLTAVTLMVVAYRSWRFGKVAAG